LKRSEYIFKIDRMDDDDSEGWANLVKLAEKDEKTQKVQRTHPRRERGFLLAT
jgi:hypothetical protein